MALGRLRTNMAMDEDEDARLLKVACTRDLAGQPFPVVHFGTLYSKHCVASWAVFPEARRHQAETLEDLDEDAPALLRLHLMDDDRIDDQSAEGGVPSDEPRRAR